MLDKSSFRKTVFAFLLPMAIQNLINVAISSTDVIMLGRYRQEKMFWRMLNLWWKL